MSERKDARRGLGRGLSALMSDIEVPTEQDTAKSTRADRMVPIETVHPNDDQPRRSFSDKQLQELADSVRTKGIVQPLIVRAHPEKSGHFQIVAGERRWRAAQIAAMHEVPVLLRDYDDEQVLEVAIIENVQRADLNAIEEAAGYDQLMKRFGHTQEQIATALGKSRSHIANLLRLLSLPETVKDMVVTGKLSAGHARTLVTSEEPTVLAERIVAKGLSVREAEKLARSGDGPTPRKSTSAPKEKDADTKALEGDLSAALGMKVRVDHKPGSEGGQVVIDYASLDDLDTLCMVLSAPR